MLGYSFIVGGTGYIANNLMDGDIKIVWEKSDSGLVYKKRLDGTLMMNRSNNEELYDAITGMTLCHFALVRLLDSDGNLLAESMFRRLDIEFNDDKCLFKIKLQYYEAKYACIGNNGDKEYNTLRLGFTTYTIQYSFNRQYEFKECYENDVDIWNSYWNGSKNVGLNDGNDNLPPTYRVMCGTHSTNDVQQLDNGWTFWGSSFTNPRYHTTGDPPEFGTKFDVITTWFREVKYVPIVDNDPQGNQPPSGNSTFDFFFVANVMLIGQHYHKWVRCVDSLVWSRRDTPIGIIDEYPVGVTEWRILHYFGSSNNDRVLHRCRRLQDILSFFADQCGCELKSQFFQNRKNPISGRDLSNLMIVQKSDAKYAIPDDGTVWQEKSDPATIGMMDFNKLMASLAAMFQVDWYINDQSELVIEHISYFRNNLSYSHNPPSVGIDLTTDYPICLTGTNAYSYKSSLPIREKFSFMEAWNIDFVGVDIEYTNCLIDGTTESHEASIFTTDVDPVYIDTEATNDGFFMFHCDYDGNVYKEKGELSSLDQLNGHLSWANLHKNYWIYNRPIGEGMMNNKLTEFIENRKLKEQISIQFPFCVENFNPNLLVRTKMGNGEIKEAEYSLKTGNLKIQLIYE